MRGKTSNENANEKKGGNMKTYDALLLKINIHIQKPTYHTGKLLL